MPKCNFIYIIKKIMAFLAPIFTKFTIVRKNYVQASHNEFRKKISVQIIRIISMMLPSKVWLTLCGTAPNSITQ